MEVCLQLQLVEIEVGRFQEAIFEIVEVEEHTVGIELWLRIAVGKIEFPRTSDLYVWQLAYGSRQT